MYPLPGPLSKEIWDLDEEYVVSGRSNISQSVPIAFERGSGISIWDMDGNEYMDFSAGILTASTGHCHPHVVARTREQLEKLWHVYSYPTPERGRLGQALTQRMPPGINTYSFYCEGGITVEAALRAAGSYQKRWFFAAMTHAYHGRTLMARSLGAHNLHGFGPSNNVAHLIFPYCYRCPLNLKHPQCGLACIEASADLLQGSSTDEPAAVIFEPIAGAGGTIVPPPGAWQRMTEICRSRGMLIIADEVLTGVGRTGKFLAIENYGVEPDIVTFGKGLGSGMPIMVVGGKKAIMQSSPFGDYGGGGASTSFGGSALGVVAAMATLEVFDSEDLVGNAARLGLEIAERTRDWTEKYRIVGDMRGVGLLWGIELVKDPISKEPFDAAWTPIYQKCMANGLRLTPNRICPPLIITSAQLHRGLDILEKAISEVEKETR